MKGPKISCLLILASFLAAAIPAAASQCVECHTDVEKLKAIAQNLPQPETSSETAGKG
jgi:hypothetical protein